MENPKGPRKVRLILDIEMLSADEVQPDNVEVQEKIKEMMEEGGVTMADLHGVTVEISAEGDDGEAIMPIECPICILKHGPVALVAAQMMLYMAKVGDDEGNCLVSLAVKSAAETYQKALDLLCVHDLPEDFVDQHGCDHDQKDKGEALKDEIRATTRCEGEC